MRRLVLCCLLLDLVGGVPVDNGVVGDPEVECGPTAIDVNVNTLNDFEGHVYVKGVFLHAIVIVSFHPLFLTKVDRAYRVQCFYMEADKTVDTRLEVSMLTTNFATQTVPMPVCRYEILEGGPSGAVIEYAVVGQPVYHKWTCDSETIDTFCMVVHTCFVDDTNGEQVGLIGGNGCAIDRNLVNNIEYSADLMGGVEAHVFKYADRADLYFQCQISIIVKEPNQICPRPNCPEPGTRGAGEKNIPEGRISAPPPGGAIFPPRPGSSYFPPLGGEQGDYLRLNLLAASQAEAQPDAPEELDAAEGPRRRRSADMFLDMGELGVLDLGRSLTALDLDQMTAELRGDVELLSRRGASEASSGGVCVSGAAVWLLSVTTLGALTATLALAAWIACRAITKT